MIPVDVSEELKDLFKVYTDAEKHLKQKELSAHDSMTSYMKRYLEAMEERKKISQKLEVLTQKMRDVETEEENDDCDEEDDE